MRLKVDILSHIYNFPNLHNEIVEIEDFILNLTKDVIELAKLPEWSIWFKVDLEKEGGIVVNKKGATYPSYPPEKHYFMSIQIPTNKDIDWGVKEKDFSYRPQSVFDTVRNNWDKIEGVNFSDFENMSSYIIECSKKGFEQLLRKGISLKGVKIKV
jgi:hypothetical protein